MFETARRERDCVVHLYTMSLNEEAMLGFFFRHYDHLVDRYFVYDDGSTDRTLDMLRAHPKVECRRFERVVPNSIVASAQAFYNNVWKESRGKADWVILTAIDEHLFHPDMRAYLQRCLRAGVTAIPALGYEMVSRALPSAGETLSQAIKTGVPDIRMSKLSIFNPTALDSTGYAPGRHHASPRGTLVFAPSDEVTLLHYKHIDPAYTVKRQHALALGLRARDRANNWGAEYVQPDSGILKRFAQLEASAVDISRPNYIPHKDHCERRWWRMSLFQQRVLDGRLMFRRVVRDFVGRHGVGQVLLRHLRAARTLLSAKRLD